MSKIFEDDRGKEIAILYYDLFDKNPCWYWQQETVKDCYKRLEKQIEEEIEIQIDIISKKIISSLKIKDKIKLKMHPKYSHFGMGLYIRNNFINNNPKLKYYFDHDELSERIFNKIIEKL